MAKNTRETLLQAGAALFLEGGYHHTGTNELLERTQIPRGSFYHHFKSKRDFAIHVAQYYYEQHLPMLDRQLSDESRPPLHRLRSYFEALRDHYQRGGWRGGCLLGVLAQELSDQDEELRLALVSLFQRWRHHLSGCLREAQLRGDIRTESCDALAGFLLDSWEGALLQMKAQKSGAPLDAFLQTIFSTLLHDQKK